MSNGQIRFSAEKGGLLQGDKSLLESLQKVIIQQSQQILELQ